MKIQAQRGYVRAITGIADEARWDAQFEATGESALTALVASVETEIDEGKTLPMFDERGQFIEQE